MLNVSKVQKDLTQWMFWGDLGRPAAYMRRLVKDIKQLPASYVRYFEQKVLHTLIE